MFHSVSLLSQTPLARGSCALSSVLLGICHLLSIQQVYCFSSFIETGMVSLMQALATPSSTVHNTKYLDTYHETISGLAASS